MAVADWLAQVDAGQLPGPSWLRLELENVLADDPAWNALASQLEARGFAIARSPANDCWRLELGQEWEAYKGELSKNHRKQIRLADQNVFEVGRATLRTATDSASLERGWKLLVDLHQRRWESLGQPGCFSSLQYTSFHRAALERLLAARLLRLQWLELDGRPISVEYQLQSAGVLYGYQSGLEPEALEEQPGNLSKIATFRQALEEGFTAIDYLRGSEEYKRRWRFEPRAAIDLHVLSRRGAARLHNSVWQAGGRAKSWIKRGLQLAGLRKK
jgi:CelD/BcsL family acetyltransferase involved in cellulose biosynthesis